MERGDSAGRVPLESRERVGIDESSFYFHWDSLNERVDPERRDTIGRVVMRGDAAEKSTAVSASGEQGSTLANGIQNAMRHAADPNVAVSDRLGDVPVGEKK